MDRNVETYNPAFSSNYNNISLWMNLTHVNLLKLNKGITTLPTELGSLPLQFLDLSHNFLGIPNQTRWPWLEQSTIRKTLVMLNISFNSLTELPWNIEKLISLKTLNVSNNMLKCLPFGIQHIQNLKFLDLSHNKFTYASCLLPLSNLQYLNISTNPWQSVPIEHTADNFQNNARPGILSLSLLSAKIIMLHRFPYDTSFSSFIKSYLEKVKFCCRCECLDTNCIPKYTLYDISELATCVDHTDGIEFVLVKCYVCPSSRECDNIIIID